MPDCWPDPGGEDVAPLSHDVEPFTWRDGRALLLALVGIQLLVNAYLVWVVHEDWRQSQASFHQVSGGWARHIDEYASIAASCRATREDVQLALWRAGFLPSDEMPSLEE